jgi:hypothetical protein
LALAVSLTGAGFVVPWAYAIAQGVSPSPGSAPPPVSPSPIGTSAVVMDLSAIESVMGKNVRSPGGEDLGNIVDVLVTPSGQVRAAVIDFGGVLGVGSRKIAVDWKALEFTNFAKEEFLRIALTRNQVRVAPEFKTGDPVVILQATKQDDQKSASPFAAPDVKPLPTPAAVSQGDARKQ